MTLTKKIIGTPAWLKVSVYFLILISAAWLASRVLILDSIFFYFSIALLLSFLLLQSEGRSLLSLGIKPKGWADWRLFFGGFGLGLIALLASAAMSIWLNAGRLEFTGRVDAVFLLILIFIHLLSSFAQEFTYRGYPFQRLLRSYGPWVAQLAITLPFAIMHLKLNTSFTAEQFLMTWLTTGMGSILYGLCYLKTGKLILSIGLHMGWNLAQALVPRAPQESKTVLFHLVQDSGLYQPLNVLWPYLGVTLLLMVFVWWYPSGSEKI